MPALTDKTARLLAGFACLAIIWLMLLPRIQQTKAYQSRQQLFEDRQIDPSAMFYSELDCLEPALDRTRHRFRLREPTR